ncbi:hypothetical protein DLE01_15710 [Streptomyces sp. FT05W]|nr:hypothetical protein DLE01_15710 [Streptomyces sp. FT05W]
MARVRCCALCGARLPRDAVAGRRYCDAACRAQAYRERRAAERMFGVGVLLGGALETGDRATVRELTCPVCGTVTFAGAGRRRDAVFCSGRCRTRAWRTRAAT